MAVRHYNELSKATMNVEGANSAVGHLHVPTKTPTAAICIYTFSNAPTPLTVEEGSIIYVHSVGFKTTTFALLAQSYTCAARGAPEQESFCCVAEMERKQVGDEPRGGVA